MQTKTKIDEEGGYNLRECGRDVDETEASLFPMADDRDQFRPIVQKGKQSFCVVMSGEAMLVEIEK